MTTTPPKTYPKDSFDRFGDDLSGLLLAKLPTVADRFRLECVSRQWKRLVFNSQRQLIIDQKLIYKCSQRLPLPLQPQPPTPTVLSDSLVSVYPLNCYHCLAQVNHYSYAFKWLSVLIGKSNQIRSLKLMFNDVQQVIVDQIMDVLFNNNNNNDNNSVVHQWLTYCPIPVGPVPLQQPTTTTTVSGFHRQLTDLAIKCSYSTANITVNTCVNQLPKVAKQCPNIERLSLSISCFSGPNIQNIIGDVQCFRRLTSLDFVCHILLYSYEPNVSVNSLANCPLLKHLSLESTYNIQFTDVDLINRQLKRPASVTKINPWIQT